MLSFLDKLGARLARGMMRPLNPNAIVILAVYTFAWGTFVGNPIWTVFDQAPLYDWLNSVMREFYWGLIGSAVGVIMMYGVVRQTVRALSIGAFIGSLYWWMIAFGYFKGDWQNTGGLTAATFGFYCGYIYLNLRLNRVYYEALRSVD